jgi:hypothetical protein
MIDELKLELEKTFSRKILDRGDCEELVQDIYEKTGAVLSYNTLRRMFGLAEYRKPRVSTLDHLAVYCGFRSFNDFSQRYTEIDIWPTWENLYVSLSLNDPDKLVEILLFRKRRNDHFTISFTVIVHELLHRKDFDALRTIFECPEFQFGQLPYDEVAQIGVLIGLHFRNFDDIILECKLLDLPNFRDIVFKIFVDYVRMRGKYGAWIHYLSQQNDIDEETRTFIACLEAWRFILMQEKIPDTILLAIPVLSIEQHPILFGRIFSMKMLQAADKKEKKKLIAQIKKRLQLQPNYATELLYEPAVQGLVTRNPDLVQFVAKMHHLIHDIKFWYHFSQVSIHRVFEVSLHLADKQYTKAQSILENIPYGHIRHGYREFIEVYIAFFQLEIAKELNSGNIQPWKDNFEKCRKVLEYPIFTDAYFDNYFEKR